MIGFLITAIKIIFILGFLVLIHEGGHFLVAKLCKVKVIEFAIGFGPTIWSKQGKETKYAIRLIPLGGFVNMEGEEERSNEEGSFSNATIPKRIAIVVAGGLVNIIFALIVYFTLMSFTGNNISNIIDTVNYGYGAEIAGIQSGDKILKINDKKIRIKKDLDEILQNCNGDTLKVEVNRNDKIYTFDVMPTEEKYNYTGIYLSSKLDNPSTEVVDISQNSPAEKSGILIGDKILKVNNVDVEDNVKELVNNIAVAENGKIEITLMRNKETIHLNLEADQKANYYLGVVLKKAENNVKNNIYYAFFQTNDFALGIIDNIKMLFKGNVRINQLVGPVGIGEIVADTNGVVDFIYILSLISISLGTTNLLPFPPLDGGKIVILLIEAIRKKPLKETTEANLQMIGFCLLIGLSLIVTYNDVLRIF